MGVAWSMRSGLTLWVVRGGGVATGCVATDCVPRTDARRPRVPVVREDARAE